MIWFQRKKFIFKILACLIVIQFIGAHAIWAQEGGQARAPTVPIISPPPTPDEIISLYVPEAYGDVKKSTLGTEDKVIIHIQDSHVNYEAQTNIAKILTHLVGELSRKNNGNGAGCLIAVEGAAGPSDPGWFRLFPNKEVKETVLDYFLRRGFISGPQYFQVFAEQNVPVVGVEEAELYRENLAAFRETYAHSEEVMWAITELERGLNLIREKLYNDDLRQFSEKSAAFHSNKLVLTDYVTYLSEAAKAKEVDLGAFGQITATLEAIAADKAIDYDQVNKERTKLVDKLQSKLAQEDVSQLVSNSLYFRLGKMSSLQYYTFLEELARDNGIEIEEYPQMEKYLEALNLHSQIEAELLFQEIGRAEKKIKESLFQTKEERECDRQLRNLYLLRNLCKLEMTREELQEYRNNRDQFLVEEFLFFIEDQSTRLNLDLRIDPKVDRVNGYFQAMEKFYQAALARDEMLAARTIEAMDQQKVKTAIVVTGGFHTEGLVRKFDSENLSTMVVSPRITLDVGNAAYLDAMLNELMPLERVLRQKGNRLSQPLRMFVDLPLVGTAADTQELHAQLLMLFSAVMTLRDPQAKDPKAFVELLKTEIEKGLSGEAKAKAQKLFDSVKPYEVMADKRNDGIYIKVNYDGRELVIAVANRESAEKLVSSMRRFYETSEEKGTVGTAVFAVQIEEVAKGIISDVTPVAVEAPALRPKAEEVIPVEKARVAENVAQLRKLRKEAPAAPVAAPAVEAPAAAPSAVGAIDISALKQNLEIMRGLEHIKGHFTGATQAGSVIQAPDRFPNFDAFSDFVLRTLLNEKPARRAEIEVLFFKGRAPVVINHGDRYNPQKTQDVIVELETREGKLVPESIGLNALTATEGQKTVRVSRDGWEKQLVDAKREETNRMFIVGMGDAGKPTQLVTAFPGEYGPPNFMTAFWDKHGLVEEDAVKLEGIRASQRLIDAASDGIVREVNQALAGKNINAAKDANGVVTISYAGVPYAKVLPSDKTTKPEVMYSGVQLKEKDTSGNLKEVFAAAHIHQLGDTLQAQLNEILNRNLASAQAKLEAPAAPAAPAIVRVAPAAAPVAVTPGAIAAIGDWFGWKPETAITLAPIIETGIFGAVLVGLPNLLLTALFGVDSSLAIFGISLVTSLLSGRAFLRAHENGGIYRVLGGILQRAPPERKDLASLRRLAITLRAIFLTPLLIANLLSLPVSLPVMLGVTGIAFAIEAVYHFRNNVQQLEQLKKIAVRQQLEQKLSAVPPKASGLGQVTEGSLTREAFIESIRTSNPISVGNQFSEGPFDAGPDFIRTILKDLQREFEGDPRMAPFIHGFLTTEDLTNKTMFYPVRRGTMPNLVTTFYRVTPQGEEQLVVAIDESFLVPTPDETIGLTTEQTRDFDEGEQLFLTLLLRGSLPEASEMTPQEKTQAELEKATVQAIRYQNLFSDEKSQINLFMERRFAADSLIRRRFEKFIALAESPDFLVRDFYQMQNFVALNFPEILSHPEQLNPADLRLNNQGDEILLAVKKNRYLADKQEDLKDLLNVIKNVHARKALVGQGYHRLEHSLEVPTLSFLAALKKYEKQYPDNPKLAADLAFEVLVAGLVHDTDLTRKDYSQSPKVINTTWLLLDLIAEDSEGNVDEREKEALFKRYFPRTEKRDPEAVLAEVKKQHKEAEKADPELNNVRNELWQTLKRLGFRDVSKLDQKATRLALLVYGTDFVTAKNPFGATKEDKDARIVEEGVESNRDQIKEQARLLEFADQAASYLTLTPEQAEDRVRGLAVELGAPPDDVVFGSKWFFEQNLDPHAEGLFEQLPEYRGNWESVKGYFEAKTRQRVRSELQRMQAENIPKITLNLGYGWPIDTTIGAFKKFIEDEVTAMGMNAVVSSSMMLEIPGKPAIPMRNVVVQVPAVAPVAVPAERAPPAVAKTPEETVDEFSRELARIDQELGTILQVQNIHEAVRKSRAKKPLSDDEKRSLLNFRERIIQNPAVLELYRQLVTEGSRYSLLPQSKIKTLDKALAEILDQLLQQAQAGQVYSLEEVMAKIKNLKELNAKGTEAANRAIQAGFGALSDGDYFKDEEVKIGVLQKFAMAMRKPALEERGIPDTARGNLVYEGKQIRVYQTKDIPRERSEKIQEELKKAEKKGEKALGTKNAAEFDAVMSQLYIEVDEKFDPEKNAEELEKELEVFLNNQFRDVSVISRFTETPEGKEAKRKAQEETEEPDTIHLATLQEVKQYVKNKLEKIKEMEEKDAEKAYYELADVISSFRVTETGELISTEQNIQQFKAALENARESATEEEQLVSALELEDILRTARREATGIAHPKFRSAPGMALFVNEIKTPLNKGEDLGGAYIGFGDGHKIGFYNVEQTVKEMEQFEQDAKERPEEMDQALDRFLHNTGNVRDKQLGTYLLTMAHPETVAEMVSKYEKGEILVNDEKVKLIRALLIAHLIDLPPPPEDPLTLRRQIAEALKKVATDLKDKNYKAYALGGDEMAVKIKDPRQAALLGALVDILTSGQAGKDIQLSAGFGFAPQIKPGDNYANLAKQASLAQQVTKALKDVARNVSGLYPREKYVYEYGRPLDVVVAQQAFEGLKKQVGEAKSDADYQKLNEIIANKEMWKKALVSLGPENNDVEIKIKEWLEEKKRKEEAKRAEVPLRAPEAAVVGKGVFLTPIVWGIEKLLGKKLTPSARNMLENLPFPMIEEAIVTLAFPFGVLPYLGARLAFILAHAVQDGLIKYFGMPQAARPPTFLGKLRLIAGLMFAGIPVSLPIPALVSLMAIAALPLTSTAPILFVVAALIHIALNTYVTVFEPKVYGHRLQKAMFAREWPVSEEQRKLLLNLMDRIQRMTPIDIQSLRNSTISMSKQDIFLMGRTYFQILDVDVTKNHVRILQIPTAENYSPRVGDAQIITYLFKTSNQITFGRNPASDVSITDPYASENHAVLRIEKGQMTLQDLKSGNGTFLYAQPAEDLLAVELPPAAPPKVQPSLQESILLTGIQEALRDMQSRLARITSPEAMRPQARRAVLGGVTMRAIQDYPTGRGNEFFEEMEEVQDQYSLTGDGPSIKDEGYFATWNGGEGYPNQGWKVHVANAFRPSVDALIATKVTQYLRDYDVSHKILRANRIKALAESELQRAGGVRQALKMVTMYPKDRGTAIQIAAQIEMLLQNDPEIKEAMKKLPQEERLLLAKEVQGEEKVIEGGWVSFRFGSFSSSQGYHLIDPRNKSWIEDRRDRYLDPEWEQSQYGEEFKTAAVRRYAQETGKPVETIHRESRLFASQHVRTDQQRVSEELGRYQAELERTERTLRELGKSQSEDVRREASQRLASVAKLLVNVKKLQETQRPAPAPAVRPAAIPLSIAAQTGAATLISQDHPDHNEDTHFVQTLADGSVVSGVFDGVGGHGGGEHASDEALKTVQKGIAEKLVGATAVEVVKEQLKEIFAQAGVAIQARANLEAEKQKDERLLEMSTTGVVARAWVDIDGKSKAVIANSGDSRAYILRASGELEPLTADDSGIKRFASEWLKEGWMTEEQFKRIIFMESAEDIQKVLKELPPDIQRNIQDYVIDNYHPRMRKRLVPDNPAQSLFNMRNVIAESVGSSEPTFYTVELQAGDRLFLTSDGVHDNLTNAEIQRFARQAAAGKAAEALVAEARKVANDEKNPRQKEDDITAVEIVIAPAAKARAAEDYWNDGAVGRVVPPELIKNYLAEYEALLRRSPAVLLNHLERFKVIFRLNDLQKELLAIALRQYPAVTEATQEIVLLQIEDSEEAANHYLPIVQAQKDPLHQRIYAEIAARHPNLVKVAPTPRRSDNPPLAKDRSTSLKAGDTFWLGLTAFVVGSMDADAKEVSLYRYIYNAEGNLVGSVEKLDVSVKMLASETGVTFGRQTDNNVIVSDPYASRHHAYLKMVQGVLILTSVSEKGTPYAYAADAQASAVGKYRAVASADEIRKAIETRKDKGEFSARQKEVAEAAKKALLEGLRGKISGAEFEKVAAKVNQVGLRQVDANVIGSAAVTLPEAVVVEDVYLVGVPKRFTRIRSGQQAFLRLLLRGELPHLLRGENRVDPNQILQEEIQALQDQVQEYLSLTAEERADVVRFLEYLAKNYPQKLQQTNYAQFEALVKNVTLITAREVLTEAERRQIARRLTVPFVLAHYAELAGEKYVQELHTATEEIGRDILEGRKSFTEENVVYLGQALKAAWASGWMTEVEGMTARLTQLSRRAGSEMAARLRQAASDPNKDLPFGMAEESLDLFKMLEAAVKDLSASEQAAILTGCKEVKKAWSEIKAARRKSARDQAGWAIRALSQVREESALRDVRKQISEANRLFRAAKIAARTGKLAADPKYEDEWTITNGIYNDLRREAIRIRDEKRRAAAEEKKLTPIAAEQRAEEKKRAEAELLKQADQFEREVAQMEDQQRRTAGELERLMIFTAGRRVAAEYRQALEENLKAHLKNREKFNAAVREFIGRYGNPKETKRINQLLNRTWNVVNEIHDTIWLRPRSLHQDEILRQIQSDYLPFVYSYGEWFVEKFGEYEKEDDPMRKREKVQDFDDNKQIREALLARLYAMPDPGDVKKAEKLAAIRRALNAINEIPAPVAVEEPVIVEEPVFVEEPIFVEEPEPEEEVLVLELMLEDAEEALIANAPIELGRIRRQVEPLFAADIHLTPRQAIAVLQGASHVARGQVDELKKLEQKLTGIPGDLTAGNREKVQKHLAERVTLLARIKSRIAELELIEKAPRLSLRERLAERARATGKRIQKALGIGLTPFEETMTALGVDPRATSEEVAQRIGALSARRQRALVLQVVSQLDDLRKERDLDLAKKIMDGALSQNEMLRRDFAGHQYYLNNIYLRIRYGQTLPAAVLEGRLDNGADLIRGLLAGRNFLSPFEAQNAMRQLDWIEQGMVLARPRLPAGDPRAVLRERAEKFLRQANLFNQRTRDYAQEKKPSQFQRLLSSLAGLEWASSADLGESMDARAQAAAQGRRVLEEARDRVDGIDAAVDRGQAMNAGELKKLQDLLEISRSAPYGRADMKDRTDAQVREEVRRLKTSILLALINNGRLVGETLARAVRADRAGVLLEPNEARLTQLRDYLNALLVGEEQDLAAVRTARNQVVKSVDATLGTVETAIAAARARKEERRPEVGRAEVAAPAPEVREEREIKRPIVRIFTSRSYGAVARSIMEKSPAEVQSWARRYLVDRLGIAKLAPEEYPPKAEARALYLDILLTFDELARHQLAYLGRQSPFRLVMLKSNEPGLYEEVARRARVPERAPGAPEIVTPARLPVAVPIMPEGALTLRQRSLASETEEKIVLLQVESSLEARKAYFDQWSRDFENALAKPEAARTDVNKRFVRVLNQIKESAEKTNREQELLARISEIFSRVAVTRPPAAPPAPARVPVEVGVPRRVPAAPPTAPIAPTVARPEAPAAPRPAVPVRIHDQFLRPDTKPQGLRTHAQLLSAIQTKLSRLFEDRPENKETQNKIALKLQERFKAGAVSPIPFEAATPGDSLESAARYARELLQFSSPAALTELYFAAVEAQAADFAQLGISPEEARAILSAKKPARDRALERLQKTKDFRDMVPTRENVTVLALDRAHFKIEAGKVVAAPEEIKKAVEGKNFYRLMIFSTGANDSASLEAISDYLTSRGGLAAKNISTYFTADGIDETSPTEKVENFLDGMNQQLAKSLSREGLRDNVNDMVFLTTEEQHNKIFSKVLHAFLIYLVFSSEEKVFYVDEEFAKQAGLTVRGPVKLVPQMRHDSKAIDEFKRAEAAEKAA